MDGGGVSFQVYGFGFGFGVYVAHVVLRLLGFVILAKDLHLGCGTTRFLA